MFQFIFTNSSSFSDWHIHGVSFSGIYNPFLVTIASNLPLILLKTQTPLIIGLFNAAPFSLRLIPPSDNLHPFSLYSSDKYSLNHTPRIRLLSSVNCIKSLSSPAPPISTLHQLSSLFLPSIEIGPHASKPQNTDGATMHFNILIDFCFQINK